MLMLEYNTTGKGHQLQKAHDPFFEKEEAGMGENTALSTNRAAAASVRACVFAVVFKSDAHM